MDEWQIVGFAASICGALTFIPEIVQALRSKHLEDLSWGVLLLLSSSSVLWFLYGLRFTLLPLLFSASANLIMCICLTYLKKKYGPNSKKLSIIVKKISIQNKI